ncbi:MAG: hypothetical protein JSV04_01880 [Candidatus Heimdallarchaeota archaeon]|nr:MAG: hypothetical protein JSV04_01880 [Candidatus Heimdallarchaeota archaeon]
MKIIKKTLFPLLLVIFLILVSLTLLNVSGVTSSDPMGFISPNITGNIDLNDGQIASFWTSIETYHYVSEFGDNGYVKFSNNRTHLFALLVSSSDEAWISIEFEPDPSLCMKNLNDGWSVYIDKDNEEVLAKDVKFVGTVIPEDDVHNDLHVESLFSEGMVYIEVVRLFNTADTDGYDITFQNGSINYLKFASKGKHFGTHEIYYLYNYVPAEVSTTENPTTDVSNTDTTNTDITSTTTTTTDIIIVIPTDIPDLPDQDVVDLSQVKFLLLGLTPIGIIGFISLHLVRRVLTSPIKHDHDRIVSSSWKPPTTVDRFKDTFLSDE